MRSYLSLGRREKKKKIKRKIKSLDATLRERNHIKGERGKL